MFDDDDGDDEMMSLEEQLQRGLTGFRDAVLQDHLEMGKGSYWKRMFLLKVDVNCCVIWFAFTLQDSMHGLGTNWELCDIDQLEQSPCNM